MIELSRKRNDSIVIGNEITVEVIEILEDKVRLGIEYPLDFPIRRGETYEAIRRIHGDERLSEIQDMDRKKAEILSKVQGQLSKAVKLEQLLELERKLT